MYAFSVSPMVYTSKLKTAGPVGGGYDIEFAWSDIIPDAAFSDMQLMEVTLPDTVKKIGSMSFYSCYGLSSVAFPSSLEEIGAYAFAGTSLSEVILPNSITKLGESVFYDCASLQSVTIPETILFLPEKLFYNCRNLSEITISPNLISIGDYSFYSCTNLSEIDLPDSLEQIGVGSFSGCTKLSAVAIPNRITTIKASSFCNCDSLSEVLLSGTLENIEREAFNGSTNLTSIILPASIKSIGADAFNYLSGKGIQSCFLSDVYYYGTQVQWDRITFGESTFGISEPIETAHIHYANTVTFDLNGENASVSPEEKTVIEGLPYGILPTPTLANNRFDGWFTAKNGGTQIKNDTIVALTANQTLYAHWSKSYNVSSDAWSFGNSASSFGYTNPGSGNNYPIKYDVFSIIFKSRNGDNIQLYKDIIKGGWNGNCAGMAATSALLFGGEAVTPLRFRKEFYLCARN